MLAVNSDTELWFLYIIRCKNNELYTGISKDVSRRFLEHQKNGCKTAKYLRGKGPLTLVFSRQIGSKSEALRAEAMVKRLSKKEKESLLLDQREAIFRTLTPLT